MAKSDLTDTTEAIWHRRTSVTGAWRLGYSCNNMVVRNQHDVNSRILHTRSRFVKEAAGIRGSGEQHT